MNDHLKLRQTVPSVKCLSGVGAIVTTAVMLAAATAASFSFADKGSGLGKYIETISGMISENKTDDATQYTHQLVAAYDKHIADIKTENKTNKKSTSGKKRTNSRLSDAQLTRRILELMRGNVLMVAGKMPENDWLSMYEGELNRDEKKPKRIMHRISQMPENIFTADMADTLLKGNIPQKTREWLKHYLFGKKVPPKKKSDVIWVEFYEELALKEADIEKKKNILNQYVSALNKRGERNGVNRALDNIIKLRADTELGVEAARLRLACVKDEEDRDKQIIKIVDEHPATAISSALKDHYVVALAEQGRFEDAVKAIDNERILEKSVDREDRIKNLITLVQKLCGIKPKPIQNSRTGVVEEKQSEPLAPAFVYAGLAEKFLETKHHEISVAMSFSALRSKDALPLNLSTGVPIDSVSDISQTDDSKQIHDAAMYLAAQAHYAAGNNSSAEKILQGLPEKTTPDNVRSYALYLEALIAASSGDTDTALQQAGKALEIEPNSPVLRTFISLQKRSIKKVEKNDNSKKGHNSPNS